MDTLPAGISAFDRPPPYGLVRNWLGAEAVAQLLAFADARQTDFVPSSIGYGHDGTIDRDTRQSTILKPFDDPTGLIVSALQRLLPDMIATLGATPFAARHVLELVAHNDGAFFKRHLDTVIKDGVPSTRAISAVYYFHRSPKAFSGGVLRLYALSGSEASGHHVDIEPANDTLVYFPSWYPHEVLPVSVPGGAFADSRFAVNCWIHRRERGTGA